MKDKKILEIKNLNAYFFDTEILHNISLDVYEHQVLALIGPSGCGKSTLIRCLNRMHEETLGAHIKGDILLESKSIYKQDPVLIRKQIGMVFQKPNPFPGMSVFDNVSLGLKLAGIKDKATLSERVESSLKQAALWDEVKNKLNLAGTSLSGGQQQRLCIARSLAMNPSIILMDEPTSALDPISTGRIEDLIQELKKTVTIIIVTHNMQQAARVSNFAAFLYLGDLIEYNKTSRMFTNPDNPKTESYITGRFG